MPNLMYVEIMRTEGLSARSEKEQIILTLETQQDDDLVSCRAQSDAVAPVRYKYYGIKGGRKKRKELTKVSSYYYIDIL